MASNGVELGLENMKINNNASSPNSQPMYRPLKKKLPRTYINILHDPRVVRGNTYAAFVIPSSLQKEFMYLKEQEERRKRLLKHPKMLPRVAYLSMKLKEEKEDDKELQEQRPESPKLQELEDPEFIEDYPYFYIDKPPTPKYVPLPPGREIASQVEDGELFDYELEVKPILEVLVGRSLIQARMELIEDHERKEYLKHKKQYDQLREFELINLQRQEAARIRREEEKRRRENQKQERKKLNIVTQKKLIANTFAKRLVFPLKKLCYSHLMETGVLRNPQEFSYVKLIDRTLISTSEEIDQNNKQIEIIIKDQLIRNVKDVICKGHKNVVQEHNKKLEDLKEEKERLEKKLIEDEKQRKIDKENERERRRNDRIRKRIEETNIATKIIKQDLINLNLADIDEFSFKSEHVHTLGGYLGEFLIVFNEMYEKYLSRMDEQEIVKAFNMLLSNLLLSMDKRILEFKYFETIKIDMNIAIDKADPTLIDNYKGIYYDTRRIASKSIKYMLENNLINEKIYNYLLDATINLLLQKPVDPEIIEKDKDPNNTEPEYLEKLQKEKDEIKHNNDTLIKLKEKVRFTYAKVDEYKKKKNKMAAIVNICPQESNEVYKEEENDPNAVKQENPSNQTTDQPPKVEVHDENAIKYTNNVHVFQNTILPYDFYIIHDGVTDIFKLKILSEFKKFFGKENFNLQENLEIVKKKFDSLKEHILGSIKINEKYFEKEIKGYKPLFNIAVSFEENKPDPIN